MQLELESTNDSTELFERSVEYKDKVKKKENRKLKKMVSLDAFAEEYAAKSPSKHRNQPRDNTDVSTLVAGKDKQTVSTVVSEIAKLQTASAGHRDPMDGHWKSADPFAPSNVIGDIGTSEPSTPGKDVELPLRPKITLQPSESAKPQTLTDELSSISVGPTQTQEAGHVERALFKR